MSKEINISEFYNDLNSNVNKNRKGNGNHILKEFTNPIGKAAVETIIQYQKEGKVLRYKNEKIPHINKINKKPSFIYNSYLKENPKEDNYSKMLPYFKKEIMFEVKKIKRNCQISLGIIVITKKRKIKTELLSKTKFFNPLNITKDQLKKAFQNLDQIVFGNHFGQKLRICELTDEEFILIYYLLTEKQENIINQMADQKLGLYLKKYIVKKTNKFASDHQIKKAIKEGKLLFKDVHLKNGFFENNLFKNEKFDLIICGFFLFLTPPEKILKIFSKIDDKLNYNGHVIIYDFYNKGFHKKM